MYLSSWLTGVERRFLAPIPKSEKAGYSIVSRHSMGNKPYNLPRQNKQLLVFTFPNMGTNNIPGHHASPESTPGEGIALHAIRGETQPCPRSSLCFESCR